MGGLLWYGVFMKKRTIQLSNAAFAALWALAGPDDEDEEQIIMRLATAPKSLKVPSQPHDGFLDERFQVHFPEGAVIYRNRKGDRHEAKVVDGRWQLDGTRERYDSLGALNAALDARNESAWTTWFYDDADGERQSIMKLREV
jgi:hypothetical protein